MKNRQDSSQVANANRIIDKLVDNILKILPSKAQNKAQLKEGLFRKFKEVDKNHYDFIANHFGNCVEGYNEQYDKYLSAAIRVKEINFPKAAFLIKIAELVYEKNKHKLLEKKINAIIQLGSENNEKKAQSPKISTKPHASPVQPPKESSNNSNADPHSLNLTADVTLSIPQPMQQNPVTPVQTQPSIQPPLSAQNFVSLSPEVSLTPVPMMRTQPLLWNSNSNSNSLVSTLPPPAFSLPLNLPVKMGLDLMASDMPMQTGRDTPTAEILDEWETEFTPEKKEAKSSNNSDPGTSLDLPFFTKSLSKPGAMFDDLANMFGVNEELYNETPQNTENEETHREKKETVADSSSKFDAMLDELLKPQKPGKKTQETKTAIFDAEPEFVMEETNVGQLEPVPMNDDTSAEANAVEMETSNGSSSQKDKAATDSDDEDVPLAKRLEAGALESKRQQSQSSSNNSSNNKEAAMETEENKASITKKERIINFIAENLAGKYESAPQSNQPEPVQIVELTQEQIKDLLKEPAFDKLFDIDLPLFKTKLSRINKDIRTNSSNHTPFKDFLTNCLKISSFKEAHILFELVSFALSMKGIRQHKEYAQVKQRMGAAKEHADKLLELKNSKVQNKESKLNMRQQPYKEFEKIIKGLQIRKVLDYREKAFATEKPDMAAVKKIIINFIAENFGDPSLVKLLSESKGFDSIFTEATDAQARYLGSISRNIAENVSPKKLYADIDWKLIDTLKEEDLTLRKRLLYLAIILKLAARPINRVLNAKNLAELNDCLQSINLNMKYMAKALKVLESDPVLKVKVYPDLKAIFDRLDPRGKFDKKLDSFRETAEKVHLPKIYKYIAKALGGKDIAKVEQLEKVLRENFKEVIKHIPCNHLVCFESAAGPYMVKSSNPSPQDHYQLGNHVWANVSYFKNLNDTLDSCLLFLICAAAHLNLYLYRLEEGTKPHLIEKAKKNVIARIKDALACLNQGNNKDNPRAEILKKMINELGFLDLIKDKKLQQDADVMQDDKESKKVKPTDKSKLPAPVSKSKRSLPPVPLFNAPTKDSGGVQPMQVNSNNSEQQASTRPAQSPSFALRLVGNPAGKKHELEGYKGEPAQPTKKRKVK